MPLASVEILAPIPRPHRNIFCVGKNYHAHAKEFTQSGFDSSAKDASETIPTAPIIFSKVPDCADRARGADPLPHRRQREGRLRGRAGGGDRQGRPRHRQGRRL